MDYAFGKVTVPVPGTPQSAAKNIATSQPRTLQSIQFQALPANTGKVYIRLKGDPTIDDRTDLEQTIAILPAPTDDVNGPFASASRSVPNVPAALVLGLYYIDADVANDGVIVSGTAQ